MADKVDGFYEISELFGHRQGNDGPEYLVQWSNYPEPDWTPIDQLYFNTALVD